MNEWHLDIPSVNDADSSLNQIDQIPKWDTTTREKIDPNFCARVNDSYLYDYEVPHVDIYGRVLIG